MKNHNTRALIIRNNNRVNGLYYGFWRKLFASVIFIASVSLSHATNITLYNSFAGNLNYVTGGGTLRTQADPNSCTTTLGPVSAPISGIPAGSTIVAALLYWAGSGTSSSTTPTFNGSSITADRNFSEAFVNGGNTFNFFGGFKNVTSSVTGNGTYTFGNLTVQTTDVSGGATYCSSQAVLSGFALIVLYSNPSEKFRVINVFDGMQEFYGSSITLNPNNFVIPGSSIDGKFAILTWEGDVGNSASLNGFSENITFNGNVLSDAADPVNNQFNSTINTYGTGNIYYGVDLDTYDISPYLTAGNTSATTVYSSGGDLVLLGAQIISVTNDPTADLQATISHTGTFAVNTNGDYTITVKSAGPSNTVGTVTVTDTLPAGLTYVSAIGTGWTCSAVGQVVTCTMTNLASGVTAPTIDLKVAVGNAAYPNVTNSATVSGPLFDNVSSNNTGTDTAAVVTGVDLSGATKTVVDVNGGEPNIGDVLSYTITLTNPSTISDATSVVVTDDIPANVTNFTVISLPTVSTNVSTGTGTGANNNGYLNITGIKVPKNSSVTIVYEVTIAPGTAPDTVINNTATVTNPAGAGATPSAPSVVVSPSLAITSGQKDFYLDNTSSTIMSRVRSTSVTATTVTQATSTTFTLNALAGALTMSAGTITITLQLARTGNAATGRTVSVTYADGTNNITSTAQNITFSTTAYQQAVFTISLPTATPIAAGANFTLKINNTTSGSGGNRNLLVLPLNSGAYSKVDATVTPVINVDSVKTYSAAYPSTTTQASYDSGNVVYFRAVVSDPFGYSDITAANLTLVDAASATQVSSAAMTSVATSGTLRTYEYAYTVPATYSPGNWSATVVAKEGVENTITDSGVASLRVGMPVITVVKSDSLISDPIIGTGANRKRVPGSVIEYFINVTNSGKGRPDPNALVITDILPNKVMMCFTSSCGVASPIAFSDGSVSSGLTFNYATGVSYSNQTGGGAPYNYVPNPDSVTGYDANVTGVRIVPSGTMLGNTGSGNPSFTLQLIVQIK